MRLRPRHQKLEYAGGLYFSEGNMHDYSFSRADWGSCCWENTVNPRKEKRLADLNLNNDKLKIRSVIWKKIMDTECEWVNPQAFFLSFWLDHRRECELWIPPIHIDYFEVLLHWWHSTIENLEILEIFEKKRKGAECLWVQNKHEIVKSQRSLDFQSFGWYRLILTTDFPY